MKGKLLWAVLLSLGIWQYGESVLPLFDREIPEDSEYPRGSYIYRGRIDFGGNQGISLENPASGRYFSATNSLPDSVKLPLMGSSVYVDFSSNGSEVLGMRSAKGGGRE
jgi:hypothetical protein